MATYNVEIQDSSGNIYIPKATISDEFDILSRIKGYTTTVSANSAKTVYTEIIKNASNVMVAKRVTTKNSSTKYTEVITFYESNGSTVKETKTITTTNSSGTYTIKIT